MARLTQHFTVKLSSGLYGSVLATRLHLSFFLCVQLQCVISSYLTLLDLKIFNCPSPSKHSPIYMPHHGCFMGRPAEADLSIRSAHLQCHVGSPTLIVSSPTLSPHRVHMPISHRIRHPLMKFAILSQNSESWFFNTSVGSSNSSQHRTNVATNMPICQLIASSTCRSPDSSHITGSAHPTRRTSHITTHGIDILPHFKWVVVLDNSSP